MAQVKTDAELEAEFSALAPKVPGQPGTDDSELEAEFAKLSPVGQPAASPAPVTSTESQLTRLPRMAGHSLASATQNLLGLPGSLEQWGNKNLPSWATNELTIDSTGAHFAPPGSRNPLINLGATLPTAEQMRAETGLGLELNPDLEANNAAEKYLVQAPMKMLPDAALMWATGGGALPSLMTSAGATYAAEAVEGLDPGNPVLPIVAALAGAIGGYSAAGKIMTKVEQKQAARAYTAALSELDAAKQAIKDAKYVPKETTAEEALLEAAQDAKWEEGWVARMGREPTEAERLLEKSKRFKFEAGYDANKAAGELKSAAEKARQATAQLADETFAAVDEEVAGVYTNVADTLGKTKTIQEAGAELQAAAQNWKKNVLPTKVADIEKPLKDAIPDSTTMEMPNFTGVAKQLSEEAGSLQVVADLFSGNVPKQVLNRLEARNELGELMEEGAEAVAKPMTWAEVRALRTRIGDAISNPALIKGVSEQQLSAMYAALTKDLGSTAKAAGAEDVFKTYNQQMTELSAFQENVLSKIIKSSNEAKESLSPEAAATAMLAEGAKGGTWIAALRAEMPDAANALASATVRQGEKAWAALSPEAQLALVPDGEKVGALAKTAQTRAAAEAQTKAAKAQAEADYRDFADSVDAGVKEGSFKRTQQVMDLQAERNAAAATQRKAELKAQMEREKAVREAQKAQREAAQEAANKAKAEAKIRESRKDIADKMAKKAAERVAKAEQKADPVSMWPQRVMGAFMGDSAMPFVLQQMGVQPGFASNALGIAAGSLMLPASVSAAKTLVKNPLQVGGVAATGVTAGQNASTASGRKDRPAGR